MASATWKIKYYKSILTDLKEKFGKLCQEHLADTTNYVTKELHRELYDRFNFRPEDLINSERFKFHYEDSNLHWSQCKPIEELRNIVDFTTAFLGLSPIFSEPSSVWFPPNFEDTERYTFESCMQDTYKVNFGIFNNERISISTTGYVDTWLENNFSGTGKMEIESDSDINRIMEVTVLGRVTCTGTAVLLDKCLGIWFYNPPDVVDRYLFGKMGQAALVNFPEYGMTKDVEIQFLEEWEQVNVEVHDWDSDDDEQLG